MTVRSMALLAMLCTSWLGAAAESGGIPHIRNGAEPQNGTRTLTLRELWRAGGDDEEEILMGVITDALLAPDGSLLLLDRQLGHILVYSPEGEFLRIMSGEGDGPGEVRMPMTPLDKSSEDALRQTLTRYGLIGRA